MAGLSQLRVCTLLVIATAVQAQPCKAPPDLEKAVTAKPSAAGYNAIGAWFGQRQKIDCALQSFEKALKFDPTSVDTRYNLGIALLEAGQPKRAAVELDFVTRRRPGLPPAQTAFGMALFESAEFPRAESALRAALKLDPQNAHAKEFLARTLIELKRFSAATELLSQLPENPETLTTLAMAQSQSRQPGAAIETLKRVVALAPRDSRSHFNLAGVFANEKRFREAADAYRECLKLDAANDVARVSLVKSLAALNENEEALPLIQDFARRNPGDPDGPYLLGVVHRGMGNYAEAEPLLQKAASIRPDHYDTHYNLGFVQLRAEKLALAEASFRKALILNPDSSEARFQLGTVLRRLGKPDEARQEISAFEKQKQQTAQSNMAGVTANQANDLLQQGDAARAAEAYRESLKLDPNNARTHYNLALALATLKDHSHERSSLERAVALDPKLAAAQNQLGMLDLQAGNLSQAERRLKAAVDADPQFAEAQSNLGVLYGQQGKNAQAEKMFRLAIENSPKFTQAFVNLGLVIAAQGRLPEAEKELRAALAIDPNHLQAMTALGMVLTKSRRPAEGVAAFQRVTELTPKAPEAFLNLGIAHGDQFEYEQALAAFTEAARLAPELPAARYNKGRALFDLRRYEEALPELAKAESPESWYLQALAEKQLGHPDRSSDLLRRVVAGAPGHSDAYYQLGQNLHKQGKLDQAITHWKKALELNQDHSQALFSLIRSLHDKSPAEAQRYQQALDALQQRRHMTDRAEMLSNLGLSAAASHDWPQAFAHLEEALQVCGECRSRPALHKNLGLIYCRSGEIKKGAAQLEIAQRLKPDDPDVLKALEVIRKLP